MSDLKPQQAPGPMEPSESFKREVLPHAADAWIDREKTITAAHEQTALPAPEAGDA